MKNYLCYLREQGYDVSVVCHPGQWLQQDTHTPDGIFVKIIPFPPRITPLADLKTLICLVRYFRQEQFHVVHTHTVKPGLLGRLAARLAGVPVIIHTVHGFYFHDGMHPAARRVFIAIEKIAARCCDAILSQNQEDIATAIREGICPPAKISRLGNGIDVTKFYPGCVDDATVAGLRHQLELPPNVKVVGLIGRLVREKGFLEFFEAARIILDRGINARFLVIGAAQPEKSDALTPQALIDQLGLQSAVHFLGLRDDILALMSLMDVIALPSYHEGLPRVLMEAAALVKPVVATDVRGCREVVADGETGLLVPAQDSAALAEGLIAVLSDANLARRLGQAGRARVETMFDERLYFRRTHETYQRLLKGKSVL
ncbi:MAG: glycosyltransferase family 4 protein [Anaerolineae bacterium]|nr:glycosyltransferase family 4 protein [Anaerolineae bacterium]